MKIKKKLYALVCQNDGAEERPIILEGYIDCSDHKSVHERIMKYKETYGECWMVELPMCLVDGKIEINIGEEKKIKQW